MTLKSNSNISGSETSAPISGQQQMADGARSVCVASAQKMILHKRWQRRWTAACSVWVTMLLALALGETDWRATVMVSATAFMLARAGDMLDDH